MIGAVTAEPKQELSAFKNRMAKSRRIASDSE
jgi:hypothetical protein